MDEMIRMQQQMAALAPQIPTFDIERIHQVPKLDGHLASGFYERLVKWINDFEATLDSTTEVGVRLVSFGQVVTFHLLDITYWDPQLIRFDGVDGGRPVQLIQHVSQISILLMKVPKLGEHARRIGFRMDAENDGSR